MAPGGVNIFGEYGQTSGPGSVITINGVINAPVIQIDPNGAQSVVKLNNPAGVNSPATESDAQILFNGGPGQNQLVVDDSADTKPQTGTMTSGTITGLGMGGSGIVYHAVQNLTVNLGSGGDLFNVQSTGCRYDDPDQRVDGKLGSKHDQRGQPCTSLSGGVVSGVAGPLVIAGSGADTMNVDDSGDTGGLDGALHTHDPDRFGYGSQRHRLFRAVDSECVSRLGGTAVNAFNVNVGTGQNLPAHTSITGGSASNDELKANWTGDFNGTLDVRGFPNAFITVGNDFNGTLNDTNPGRHQFDLHRRLADRDRRAQSDERLDPPNPTDSSHLLGDVGEFDVGGSIAGVVMVSGSLGTLDVGPADTHTANNVNDVSGEVLVGGRR